MRRDGDSPVAQALESAGLGDSLGKTILFGGVGWEGFYTCLKWKFRLQIPFV